MPELWPWQVPVAPTFRKSNASVSGGRTLTGDEFVVRTDAGFWRATASVTVHRERAVVAWQALIAALDGRAGTVLVPVYSRWRPRDANNRMPSAAAANGLNGDPLLDHGGLGFVETPMMWTSLAAPRRATRLAVYHPHVDCIRPGHYFGLGDRMHVVARQWQISSEAPAQSGNLEYGVEGLLYGIEPIVYGAEGPVTFVGENVSMIDIWPPLREAIPAETPLILGRPVCKMRLSSDDAGALDIGWRRSADIQIELEEAL